PALNSFPTRRSSDLGRHDIHNMYDINNPSPTFLNTRRPMNDHRSDDSSFVLLTFKIPERGIAYVRPFLTIGGKRRRGPDFGSWRDRKSTRLNSSHVK